jgi:hypothetical protein
MKQSIITVILAFSAISFSLSAQEHLKGYNVAHVFHQFPGHKVNAEGIRLFDALEPDVLRFPGGTIANKYHYYKPGYGWSKADQKRRENYIVEFVRLVRAMKTRPDVVFVMNLFEHFTGADEETLIRENMDALSYLLDNGMNVAAVELGNEFYLYQEIVGLPGQVTYNPEDFNEIDHTEENNGASEEKDAPRQENWLKRWLRMLTGSSNGGAKKAETKAPASEVPAQFALYERLCREYAKRIKDIDPSIKLGVPLGNLKNKKHTAWNNFVLDRFEYVDAYVCHFYGSFKQACGRDEACIRKSLNWYLNNQVIPRLERVAATGKECWVTEWNALKFGHYGDEGAWIRNSAIHQDYTRKFIELFDTYGVTLSNFHKISGPVEGAAYNAIDVDQGQCYPTAIYDVLMEHY